LPFQINLLCSQATSKTWNSGSSLDDSEMMTTTLLKLVLHKTTSHGIKPHELDSPCKVSKKLVKHLTLHIPSG
jgi:hypothetical protein